MSEFQNNFNLVKMLLSRRVPSDVAHGIAHKWLDKRGFLTRTIRSERWTQN
jgi:hypothetical protein